MVPPQFTALSRPHPVPTDRKRDIGRTRLRLLKVSAEPLGKEFGAILLLSCTNWQLSEKRMNARTGFRHRVVLLILPLLQNKVNDFFKIKSTNGRHSIQKPAFPFVQYATGMATSHTNIAISLATCCNLCYIVV